MSTSKVEKIRAEVERRYNEKDRLGDDIRANVYKSILRFIDSMQEECNITGIKSKEVTGKLKECIDNITDESLTKARKQLQEELVNGGLDLGCGVIWKDEKSASWDLEKVVEEIVEPTILNAYGVKEIANRLRKTMIEPVSEDLGEYINELSKQFPEVSFAKLSRIAVRVAKWQKEHLWKPADGDDLPDIDREVLAILDNGKVVFAHRPPEYWDGKDIDTGKVTRNYPKTYDKGGWNIPNVRWWLDVELPKLIEL